MLTHMLGLKLGLQTYSIIGGSTPPEGSNNFQWETGITLQWEPGINIILD